MSDSFVRLAKLFKERDNKKDYVNIIGQVVSISPLKISVFDGAVLLDKDDLFIANTINNEMSIKEFKANTMTATIDGNSKTLSNVVAQTATFKTRQYLFSVGDKVLICADSTSDKYIVVSILSEVV